MIPAVDPSRFFNTSIQTQPSVQEPQAQTNRGSGIWNWITSCSITPTGAGAAATTGATTRLIELLQQNQPEIVQRVRTIFTQAILQRPPENLSQLHRHLQAYLRNPTSQDLAQIRALLNSLNAENIQAIAPSINQEGIDTLTTLHSKLNEENPNEDALEQMRTTEVILGAILQLHEGGLIQTLNTLTQSLEDPSGPLRVLRRELNSRAVAPLRECREIMDAYRAALQRNAAELRPHLQNLHARLSTLLGQRGLVPQISEDHWTLLERFGQRIQSLISTEDPLPNHGQLQTESDESLQILTTAFNAQRGMIEESADIFVEGIRRATANVEILSDRVINAQRQVVERARDVLVEGVRQATAHVVTLPNQMVNNLFSGSSTPPTQPTPESTSTAEPTAENTLNLDTLMSQGSGLLARLMTTTGGGVSQVAASSLATLVRYSFEKIQQYIREQNNGSLHLLPTITPLLQRLRNAERGSWEELTGALYDAFRFMQEQQIYLQGIRLPLNPVRIHSSVIPEFLQTITNQQNALQPPSQRAPDRVTIEMIERKTELFKMRSSSYGPAKLVAEKLCGFQTSERFYSDIYAPSSDPAEALNLSPIFRQRLFAKIDQSNLNFFRKWIAKRSYDFLMPISNFYVNAVSDGILKQTKNWIANTPTSQEAREDFFIQTFRNWLAVTSGAYTEVAETPSQHTRDIRVMMQEAMARPERNGGMTQEQLFAAVAKTGLDTFGPRIRWNETIANYFKTEIPAHSPLHFLNPIVVALNAFCSLSLKTIIFIPEWIGNQILLGGAKLALGNTALLQSFSERTIDSLNRNSPTSYAMQCLIHRQLQKVLALLQQNLNQEDNDEEAIPRNTNSRNLAISGLVEYSLEVANKGQWLTQERLHNYLHNRAPIRDRATRELEEAFLPEIMQKAVKTISVTLTTVTQSDQLHELLYNGLAIANDSFEEVPPIPETDLTAVERGIGELTDQILETAIFHAIGEQFDFTNEKQKAGIRQFIATLKDQGSTLATQMAPILTALSEGRPVSASTLVSDISSLIETSSQYHQARVDALGQSDGNRHFHTETKHHFNQMSRTLLGHCSPLATNLNTMKNLADEIVRVDKLLHSLLLCTRINQSLSDKLQNRPLSTEDTIFCKNQIQLLQHQITLLHRNQCPQNIESEIRRCAQENLTSLNRLEELKKTESPMQQLSRIFPYLQQEKQAALGGRPSTILRNVEYEVCQIINTLPFNEQKIQLNARILAFMQTRTETEMQAASTQFYNLHAQMISENLAGVANQYAQLNTNTTNLERELTQVVNSLSSQYCENKTTIRSKAAEALSQTNTIDSWSQSQNELPIWNLFPFFDMHWISETAKNLAFDRARAKIQLLFELLYQRHNYQGFVDQTLVLPFLKRFGNHHLRA